MIREAARRLMKSARFFPTPAELIEVASEVTDERVRSGHLQLPPSKPSMSLAERIESQKRIIAGFEKLGVKNKHLHRTIVELNREAQAAGIPDIDVATLPAWLRDRIAQYEQGRAA